MKKKKLGPGVYFLQLARAYNKLARA